MSKTMRGSVAALVTNIIFGFSFLFSKIALDYAHPLIILALRFTLAFAVLNLMWALGLVRLKLRGKPKKRILIMALAQPLLYFICELYGIDMTSSAISGVIISLVPVIVLALSFALLGEKPTKMQVLFSLLSLAAIVIISIASNDGNTNHLLGIILLLGAALCAAVFNLLSRKESGNYTPFERTYIMFLCGSVGFNLIAIAALRGGYITGLLQAVTAPKFDIVIIYLAVVSSILAFMLYNYSTTLISSVRSASFSNLITVVSVLAGIFIMKESLSPLQLVCCALVILGVVGVNIGTD